MTVEIRVPRLSDSEDEGILEEWLVDVGDIVEVGMPIATIETSKASVDIDSPYEGTVSKLLATTGDVLTFGDVVLELA